MSEKQFSAGGVIIKKEGGRLKILLVKDSYGHWTWPKGHIEKGEKAEEAALREIEEETGLSKVRVMEKLGKQEYWFTLKGERIFKTVYIFLFQAEGDEKIVVQRPELEDARWCTAEEALETIEYEGSRALVEKGIDIFRRTRGT